MTQDDDEKFATAMDVDVEPDELPKSYLIYILAAGLICGMIAQHMLSN